jgi:hypothetical protein
MRNYGIPSTEIDVRFVPLTTKVRRNKGGRHSTTLSARVTFWVS